MSDLMTSRFPTMRDAGMPLPERINAAIDRIAHGNGHMRVPVEATDPDIVLGDCRVELESQAAEIADLKRIRAAVIAAQPAQAEPVAEAVMDLCQDHQGPVEALAFIPAGTKLYAAQPPREPVQPLSEDKIFILTGHCGVSQGMVISIARTIEAAHGITERMSAGGTK